MKLEDLKIKVIYDHNVGEYTCWPEAFPWCLVTVKDLEDAPKQMAMSFEVMFKHSLSKGNLEYEIWDYD